MIPVTIQRPTGIEVKILFARFSDRIKAWYEDPANKRRFDDWQQKRRNGNDPQKREHTP